MIKFTHTRKEDGIVILFAAMIMSLVLVIVGASILGITVQLSNNSYKQVHNHQAISGARSGLDDALENIRISYRGANVSSSDTGSGNLPMSVETALEGVPGVNVGLPGGRANVNEIQTVSVDALPTGGTFRLINGVTSTPSIAYNATNAQIQSALEAVYGAGTVQVNSPSTFAASGRFNVQFIGSRSGQNLALMTTATSLTNRGYIPTASLDSIASWDDPYSETIGETCYQYWYGNIRTKGTPSTEDDSILVHVAVASPYRDTNVGSDCDLRQATGNATERSVNVQNGKLLILTAEVALAPVGVAPNYLPPRVAAVRWTENFGRL